MEKIIHAMMDLIASEVCGMTIDRSQYELTDEELVKLYKLSKSHDLAHLVGDVLIKNDLIGDGEIKAKFQKQIMLAVYRYEKINYELGRLRKVLNEAEIPFIPLKGSVIRQYYPEPWMRTSCDIDVLVHESDLSVLFRHLPLLRDTKPIQKAHTMSACFLTAVFIWSCITV